MRLSDGYHEIEPGRLAAVVTYMQQTERPAVVAAAAPPGMEIRRYEGADPERYRALFRAVGEPWLWFSRLRMSDEDLTATLRDSGVEVYVLTVNGMDKGLLELDVREAPDIEIVFLGVVPELVGRGAGRYLMSFAIECAWSRATRRLWLHTCTLDHPGALGFYQRFGFRAFQRAIEVSPDPRLAGELRRDAAPHVPLLIPNGGDAA